MTERATGTTPTAVGGADEVLGAKQVVKSVSFLERFTVLKGAPRELWATFATKFFTIVSYSLMNSTLVLWLASDLGYTDVKAGSVVATWSAIMTLVTILVGSLTDAIGIRRTFLLGIGLCLATRAFMTGSVTPVIALGLGLFPVAVGEALLGPVMVAATKRFATTAQRSMAFSMVYAIMNVAFLVSANVFDFVRKGLGEHGHYTVPILGTLSTYRMLFLLSLLFMLPNFIFVYFFMREGVDVTDEGVTITPAESKYRGGGMIRALVLTARDAGKDTVRIFGGLWRQPGFKRFLVFLMFATFMRMIFYHTSYTLTPFGIRELGEGAPVGRLSTINNWLIIVLVPIVGALTQRVSAYKMVVFGCIFGAMSVFIMAVPVRVYQPLADGWLGHVIGHKWLGVQGAVNPWYVSIALFFAAVSFGEAFYSPRLYEYAAVIAPKGQEASYMALSYLPFFVAKLTVGLLSGFLLAKFCPRVGERHGEKLWLVIALLTSIAPVGLILFRKYIKVQEAGREG